MQRGGAVRVSCPLIPLELEVKNSRLGRFKSMADYDWRWPRRIDREAIESLVRLDFAGPPGVRAGRAVVGKFHAVGRGKVVVNPR